MPIMARVHGIAVLGLILLGTGLWFALADDDELAPAPAPGPAAAKAPQIPDQAATARVEQPLPPSEGPAVSPAPAPAPPAAAPPAAVEAAPITVELHVRDLATQAPLPAFQWRWRSGNDKQTGDGADGQARLAVPPGAPFELLLECRGYEPQERRQLLAASVGAEPLRLDLFLAATARATGVRFAVRDDTGAAVERLQVACYRLGDAVVWQPGDAPFLPDAKATPLWQRQTSAPDGVFQLPDLQPGRYTVELAALQADDTLRPLQPAYRSFALSGLNAIDEQVDLRSGTVLTLQLAFSTGAPLDPRQLHGVGVRLRLQDDDRPIDWVTTAPPRLCSSDAMPAAGPIRARLALQPGNYSVEIRIGDAVRLSTSLWLRAGERQEESLTVP